MREGWNHNLQYHSLVLRAMPSPCARALEVGCGEGALARQLAALCGEVTAVDLDDLLLPENSPGVRFVRSDAMAYLFPEESFDFVATIATLHHLPLDTALERFRGWLRPGGVLVVIGLYRAGTLRDHAWNALALPLSYVTRALRGYTKMRAATQPPQQTFGEIVEAAQRWLPGAVMKRRLFFRYSLVWRKA